MPAELVRGAVVFGGSLKSNVKKKNRKKRKKTAPAELVLGTVVFGGVLVAKRHGTALFEEGPCVARGLDAVNVGAVHGVQVAQADAVAAAAAAAAAAGCCCAAAAAVAAPEDDNRMQARAGGGLQLLARLGRAPHRHMRPPLPPAPEVSVFVLLY